MRRICNLRQTSLSLSDIKTVLASPDEPAGVLLEKRLREIGDEILDLKAKQELLSSLLKGMAASEGPPRVNKRMWVEMLSAAGMDERAMELWHSEFERRAPEAHHEFLLSLSIPDKEVRLIRKWSAKPREADTAQGL